MTTHWKQAFSFLTGAVRRRDLAYLAAVNDEMAGQRLPHSVRMSWDAGDWGAEPHPGSITSVCVCRDQAIFLGEFGRVQVTGSGEAHEESIGEGPLDRGPLRCVRAIDGKAYAVGMDRQVYRRDSARTWTDIGPAPGETDEVFGFESVDGFGAGEIYAAGWAGEIWRYDSRWTPIDSPTNANLTNLCCAGNGTVYACGRTGMLLRGRGDAWEVVDHGATREDFWGLAWYDDRLWIASLRALYRLDGDDLEIVPVEEDPPATCYHLSTADGILWSIGAKDILAYDGADWKRIE